ncbi:MAG TPA: chemotaxis protein CheA [Bryobacteraceae bacterium]|nr:chemotaxis protein CheA [Bryobacteraceae bacterium]
MAQETEIKGMRRDWEEKIDSIAAQFVLGEAASVESMAECLAWIRQEAGRAGWDEISRLADRISGRITASSQWHTEGALAEGLEKLRRAIGEAAIEKPAAPVKTVNALAQDAGLVNDFILETREHLTSIENDLLTLDRTPAQQEALHSLFRSFHTVKGLAGFLEFESIRALAHEVETILDLARNRQMTIHSVVIDVVLESADYLKHEMNRLEAELAGAPLSDSAPVGELILRVQALNQPGAQTAGELAPPTPIHNEALLPPTPALIQGVEPEPEVGEANSSSAAVAKAANAKFSVRVDTVKLDYLLDMVGEMVIAQSMVRQDPDLAGLRNPRVTRNLTQLSRVTDEVQKTAMAMRMMPVGHLFQRVARLVRDISRKMNKPADLKLTGEDTQIDKTIVEELADPMMHMVRNSLDHGVEGAEARKAAGKPERALISLRASHQAGHILIEIEDDGRGLDKDKILAKARDRGLIPDGHALNDSEIHNLIFEPGFSTAAAVTDVSGRGVGMDVVKRQVTKLRGRIEIHSTPGKGTIFQLKLPLTLAIIDGLVVGVGGERYIVPIFTVQEMFRPAEGMLSTVKGQGEMVLVRNRLLPVVRLHRKFSVQPKTESASESLFVVAEAGGRRFCLMVDEFIGKQEVVIKSLGEGLKNIPGVAGGAILGDGRVGLILDLDGVYGDRTIA